MPAFLARIFHADLPWCGLDAIWRTAFSAFGFDTGLALLNGDSFSLHRFSDQAFSFLAHRLFRHFTPVGFDHIVHVPILSIRIGRASLVRELLQPVWRDQAGLGDGTAQDLRKVDLEIGGPAWN
jgi:hypothetical protein